MNPVGPRCCAAEAHFPSIRSSTILDSPPGIHCLPKILADDESPNPPPSQNGLFAFGNGANDTQLGKCGIQFGRCTARIISWNAVTDFSKYR
jgi:hypothetical protein